MSLKTNDNIPEFLMGKDFQQVVLLMKEHKQPISLQGLTKLCRQQNVWCRVLRDNKKNIVAAMLYIVGKYEFRVLRIVGTKTRKMKLLKHLMKQLGPETGKSLIKVWISLSELEFLKHLRRSGGVAQGIKGDFVCLWHGL